MVIIALGFFCVVQLLLLCSHIWQLPVVVVDTRYRNLVSGNCLQGIIPICQNLSNEWKIPCNPAARNMLFFIDESDMFFGKCFLGNVFWEIVDEMHRFYGFMAFTHCSV